MKARLAGAAVRWLRRPVARRLAGRLIGWILQYMSFVIPVQRLRETPSLLAFHHPQPAYPLHILLLPKRSIASFAALPAQDSALLSELVQMVQSLVQEFDLERRGYRLIVNGGPNQEIPQLHFHLVSDKNRPPGKG